MAKHMRSPTYPEEGEYSDEDASAGLRPTPSTFRDAIASLNPTGRSRVWGQSKAFMLKLLNNSYGFRTDLPSYGLSVTGPDPEIMGADDDYVSGAIEYWVGRSDLVQIWTVRKLASKIMDKAESKFIDAYRKRIRDSAASGSKKEEYDPAGEILLVEAFRQFIASYSDVNAGRALQLFDYVHTHSKLDDAETKDGRPFDLTSEREVTYHPPAIMAHFKWTLKIYRSARDRLVELGNQFRIQRRPK